MKPQIKNIFLALTLAVTASSCSESFLDRVPNDALSPTTFWQTESDALLALTGCYRQLYSPYRPEEMWFWDTTSDNAFCYHNNKDWRSIGNGSMAPSGVSVHSYFGYDEFRAFNEFLKMEPNITYTHPELSQQYRDEVRLMRCMQLFFRVMAYGDFPFTEEVYENPEDAYIPRTPKDKLLAFIKTELNEIVKNNALPTNVEAGRISIDAARAFLTRFDLITGDYNECVTIAKQVISGKNYKMPNLTYEESFLRSNEYNSEVIMSFEHNKAGGFGMWIAEFMPNSYGGWSSVVPTHSLLDEYETANGLTIDEDPTYNPENPFYNRDPRLRATIVYPGQTWDIYGDPDKFPNGFPSIVKGSGEYWADADNAPHTGMSFKKFYADPEEFSSTGGIWGCDRNFPMLRYAEVLLSYAEAMIELNKIDDSVYDAINEVRRRAEMPDVDRTKYATQESLRKLVRRERRVEFAYEGLRRYDLLRWGIIAEKMGGQLITSTEGEILDTMNDEGDYNVKLAPRSTWSKIEERNFTVGRNELLPVPQSIIDVNPNISQNPGY